MAKRAGSTPPPADVGDPLAPWRAMWDDARWDALARVDERALAAVPAAARAELSALVAGAHLQRADLDAARRFGRLARAGGVAPERLARLWLPAPTRTLALAAWAAGDEAGARARLRQSLPAADDERLARDTARFAEEAAAACAPAAAPRPAARAPAPRWLAGLADECLAAADVHDAIDTLLAQTLLEPQARFEFHQLVSDRFKERGDPVTALHFLGVAEASLATAPMPAALVRELAGRFGALGRVDAALDLAMGRWLDGGALQADPQLVRQLRAQYGRLTDPQRRQSQHGHHVLLEHLQAHAAAFAERARSRERGLTVIEIGSTREAIPGQGSTRQIAAFCLAHGLHFVTVDMDPHNSHMARETFAQLGAPFEAVTMKGEDYLRERPGPLDVVFLDAYDFEHDRHSALRQSRYEKFMGSPIDDRQCHLMHLECAQSIVARLDPDGLVCFDDTWLEDGRWVAKGVLAMPFLLEHGMALLEARNHAALLGWARALPGAAGVGA